jgi:hypothetical protein
MIETLFINDPPATWLAAILISGNDITANI